MTQDERNARAGFAALARAGSIPPAAPGPSDVEMIQAAAGALGALVINRPKYPGVVVELIGENGNAFAIIGAVAKSLRREVGRDAAGEWEAKALACGSYDALLRLALSWVTVE